MPLWVRIWIRRQSLPLVEDGIIVTGKKSKVANIEIAYNLFEGNDRPILVKNAPGVQSSVICNNRIVSRQKQASQGFNTFAEPIEVVFLQIDCSEGGDMRFEKHRITKKKSTVSAVMVGNCNNTALHG